VVIRFRLAEIGTLISDTTRKDNVFVQILNMGQSTDKLKGETAEIFGLHNVINIRTLLIALSDDLSAG
jgi:hypothetical protein